jgi:hypothetical protein
VNIFDTLVFFSIHFSHRIHVSFNLEISWFTLDGDFGLGAAYFQIFQQPIPCEKWNIPDNQTKCHADKMSCIGDGVAVGNKCSAMMNVYPNTIEYTMLQWFIHS